MSPRPRTIAGVSLVSHRALISPGERWVLCLCGSQVRIFSCTTGQLHSVLEEIADTPDKFTALVFNPINPHSQVYTASVGGSVLLWDYEDGIIVKKVTARYVVHGLYAPYRDGGLFLLQEHSERRSSIGSAKDIANRPEDDSCALFHLDSLNDVSQKKGRLVCRLLSNDPTKVAFCPRGDFLASVNHNALNVYYFKDEHFKKHLISRNTFTCIAVHPKEQCVATGDTQGRILLWRNFRESSTVSKTTVHWHSTAVLDIAFSLEGSYMWSGGWESTLVQWSLNNTDQKDFIPRLGAAIVRLSMSYDGNIIAASHSDSVIHLIGLQRNILQTIKSVSLAAADSSNEQGPRETGGVFCFESSSRCLVLRGKPGSLQFYNPSEDRLESEIDVVGQNIISSGLNNFSNGYVDAAVFSPSGAWMCTADSLITKHIGGTINLKFWARDLASSKYVLKTTVIDPHDGAPIRQMVSGNGSFLATLSDSDFKLWMIIKQKTLTGTQDVWYCVGVGDFKEYKPTAAVFSADDKTIAVAFQHLVTFWNVETSSLLDHALSPRRNTEYIRSMWYGPSNTDTFFTATKSSVTVWNLSKRSVLQTVELETTSFDRVDSLVALCGPRSVNVLEEDKLTQSVYTHNLPETSSAIAACCLMRKTDAEKEVLAAKVTSWLDEYSLFLLMCNGEIAVVDGKTTGQHANKLYTPDPQAAAFYRHLEIVKDPQTEEMNSLHLKPVARNAQELVDKLVSTPAHTLAPSRYFLGEHLNVLLKGSDVDQTSSENLNSQMDVDEAKEDEMDVEGDEGDMKIEESFRNRSTDVETSDESPDHYVALPTTTDFTFLNNRSAVIEGRSWKQIPVKEHNKCTSIPLISSMASSVLQKRDDSSRLHGELSSDDSDAYLSTSSSFENGRSPDVVEDADSARHLPGEIITHDTINKASTSGADADIHTIVSESIPTGDASLLTEDEHAPTPLDTSAVKEEVSVPDTERTAAVRHPLEAEDDPNELEKFLSDDVMVHSPDLQERMLEDPLGAHLAEKKTNKKVTFRGEDATDLVTEFVDAPDPWHYGAESSTQRVLESYAKMCLHYNVQPLPKVLEAIKRNPGGGQRSGTFDVSGENLTLNLIDTFEPIFMRMSFEELNLTNCLPNDDVAVSIMDMLEYYQMADKLIICNNRKLEFRAWLTIAKVLKKCGIYYLDVSDCLLQEASASLLTRALRIGTNLVTLHIEKCGLSGRALFLLISALQYSENVQELFLGDNKLSPNDVIHIASAFKHGWKLRVLDLRNNTIMDAGATHLLDALEDGSVRGGSLRALNVWNNFLTSNIARSLSQLLARSRLLETLNLGLNDLKDETVFTIKQSLMSNRGLRRLGLQSTSMSDEGCIALAEYLADQPRFLRLDVRYNEIKAGGWLALSHATKLCPSLIRVDMSYDLKHVTHSDTIRDTMRVIHETCQANRERFDKGTAPSAEKEPEEPEPEKYNARINKLFGAGTSTDDVAITIDDVDKPADSSEAAGDASREEQEEPPETASTHPDVSSQPTVGQSIIDSTETSSILPPGDTSSQDYPVFLGSLGNDENSTLELDIPRKKGQEMALRRSSITSVIASGPLSVSDRLADELFPVRVHPIPQASNPVTKGRFQISLVKATEKIYQSVQSVLSPTGNAVMVPLMNSQTTPPSENPPDGTKGLFNNWRASFRRGSKDGSENGGSNTLVSPSADNEGRRMNGDSKKSPDRSDNVQIGSSGETTKDATAPPVLQTRIEN